MPSLGTYVLVTVNPEPVSTDVVFAMDVVAQTASPWELVTAGTVITLSFE